MMQIETQPPPKRKFDSLDYVELVMSLEELFGKRGGTPAEIEKAVEAVKQQLDLTREQVDELRASLAEAARKAPQERRFILEDRPNSKWATVAFWFFMIALSILLWLMASTGSK